MSEQTGEALDLAAFLAVTPPFSTLEEDLRRELLARGQTRTYPAGSYVFRRGDPSQGVLFLVVRGSAVVTLPEEGRGEVVVGYRQPGDFFGETVVLTGGAYPGSVRAREELLCFLIPRAELERLIHTVPEFASFFNRQLLDRMRLLYEEMAAEQSFTAYTRREGRVLNRRVEEIMSRPVVTCRPGDPVAHAAQLMAGHNISAVVVVEGERPVGLVTERDLVTRVLARSREPGAAHNLKVAEVMTPHVVQVPVRAYLHEVLLQVVRHHVKHVAVMDGERLAGIVTLANLVRARGTGTFWVAHDIESQDSLDGLARCGREAESFLDALVAERASAREICNLMTEVYDRLVRRVIFLCEREMEAEGWGPPPVPYCFLQMGSAGRGEQTLRTDQDNALVYEAPAGDQAAAAYFGALGPRIVAGLEACGFARCKGDVMVSNPFWCRALSDWEKTLWLWIGRPSPSHVRLLTIFLDFRPVYGESRLAARLWEVVFRAFERFSLEAGHFLSHDEGSLRVPLNAFGGFLTEKTGPHRNQLDLKRSAMVHVVNCTRLFALKARLSEVSTFGRLEGVAAAGLLEPDEAEFIAGAYETLLMFRLRENLKKWRQGQEPDSYINPFKLSRREQAVLRDALSVVARLQKLTTKHFHVYWLNYFS
jgi:CBS domain-containing protein